MSTYAQPADLTAYTTVAAILAMSTPQLDALLTNAEQDLDSNLFPPVQFLTTANRKVDLADLDVEETRALNRATCAQAEYRAIMGDEFFIRGQYVQTSGPGGFSVRGRQPIIGPKVKRELSGSGLLVFGAQASPRRTHIR